MFVKVSHSDIRKLFIHQIIFASIIFHLASAKLTIDKDEVMKISVSSGNEQANLTINLKDLSKKVETQLSEEAAQLASERSFKTQFLTKVLDKGENSEYREFSTIEWNCLVVRKFMKSMPFNFPEFDDNFFYTKIRDRYKGISYRHMAMNILKNQTFFPEEVNEEIQAKLAQVRQYKLTLRLLIDSEAQDFEITKSTKGDIIQRAEELYQKAVGDIQTMTGQLQGLIESLQKSKSEIIDLTKAIAGKQKFVDSLVSTIKMLNNAQILLRPCLDEGCLSMIYKTLIADTQLTGLTTKIMSMIGPVRMLQKLVDLEKNLQNELNLALWDMRVESQRQAGGDSSASNVSLPSSPNSKQKVSKSAKPKDVLTKLEETALAAMKPSAKMVEEMMQIVQGASDARVTQLRGLIVRIQAEIQMITSLVENKKKVLSTLMATIESDLKSQLNFSAYKNYLKKLGEYKELINIVYNKQKKMVTNEKKMKSLGFLIEQMKGDKDLDYVISADLLRNVQTQIDYIDERDESIGDLEEEIIRPEYSEIHDNLFSILSELARFEFKDRENLVSILTQKADLIGKIQEIEHFLDIKLAQLLSGVQIIANETELDGQTFRSVTQCFNEIDIGRLMFMLAKTNIVINYESFMMAYLARFDYSEVRSFVLMNYAVFVDRNYLQVMSEQYKIRKGLPLEEESYRQQLISEFVSRFSFLIEVYRNKVDNLKKFYNGNFFDRQMAFLFNGMFDVKEKVKAMVSRELDVDKVINRVVSYFVSMIPFIEKVPFLKNLVSKLVIMLVKLVLEKIREIIDVQEVQLKSVMFKCIETFKGLSFKNDLEMLNYEDIFQRYDWVFTALDDIKKGKDDVNRDMYMVRPGESAEASNDNFQSPEMHKIEEIYREFIDINNAKSNMHFMFNFSKNVKLFEDKGYLLSLNRMMANKDLLVLLKEKFNVTTLDQIDSVGSRLLML